MLQVTFPEDSGDKLFQLGDKFDSKYPSSLCMPTVLRETIEYFNYNNCHLCIINISKLLFRE